MQDGISLTVSKWADRHRGSTCATATCDPEIMLRESTDHRESRDAYRSELFRHGRFRIAECKDRLQWILQRQRPRFPLGGAAWDTLHYCTTREALARLYQAQIGREVSEIAGFPKEYTRRSV